MMGAAAEDPATGTNLEVGLRNPKRIGHGKFGKWFWFDAIHVVDDETETITHIDYSSGYAITCLLVEDEAGSLLLANADAEEVNLETDGFVLD